MIKQTKAPWRYDEAFGQVLGADDAPVLYVSSNRLLTGSSDEDPFEQAHAIGHIAAAAPAILAALRHVKQFIADHGIDPAAPKNDPDEGWNPEYRDLWDTLDALLDAITGQAGVAASPPATLSMSFEAAIRIADMIEVGKLWHDEARTARQSLRALLGNSARMKRTTLLILRVGRP